MEVGKRCFGRRYGEIRRAARNGQQFDVTTICNGMRFSNTRVKDRIGQAKRCPHLSLCFQVILTVGMTDVVPLVQGGTGLNARHNVAQAILVRQSVMDVVRDRAGNAHRLGDVQQCMNQHIVIRQEVVLKFDPKVVPKHIHVLIGGSHRPIVPACQDPVRNLPRRYPDRATSPPDTVQYPRAVSVGRPGDRVVPW
jgi:hypothetical protein